MTDTPDPVGRPVADVIDAIDRFRPSNPLRYSGDDPGLLAIARLPLQAGLATRVRTMIEAGSTDQIVDVFIAAWIESARADVDANRCLHLTLARYFGGNDG
jgi:hypothetical protein